MILEAIRQSGEGLSRIELATATRLSAQTVTNITRRLLDDGFIREAGRTINGPGKPRVTLRLVADSRFAVGVHLDPALMTFVLLDLSGAIVRRLSVRTPAEDPHRIVEAMATTDRRPDRGIGVWIARGSRGWGSRPPARSTRRRARSSIPLKLVGWHRVPLREVLAEATGLPVVLEKDTTSAAVGELWTRRESADDSFVFVYLGTGIGAALARDGEAVRGSTRNIGEIGHIIVDPDGPSCSCGSAGASRSSAPAGDRLNRRSVRVSSATTAGERRRRRA